ncbi:hypothetical protein EH165_10830 [Nakamurella antarctica]|uniref:Acyl-CoA carboxylase epsilon subunit n=1 Tax=Nakamurella antarctica TaxID=1902245 RepID=A0A3G8ZMS5_9ACTN|nr:acyl-CoA carboxylase epsilon subunit [Nakamurella antarctica]AZI58550.1 hypothetical protein EH165_10830 [Nakamurella antarctica]
MTPDRERAVGSTRDRDDEDAAAVIAVIAALATGNSKTSESAPRSAWGSPAHRLGVVAPGQHAWWMSGVGR